MSQQIINIGTAPNSGNGDPLRTAFTKANSNFTDLYAAISGSLAGPVTIAAGGAGTVSLTVNGASGGDVIDAFTPNTGDIIRGRNTGGGAGANFQFSLGTTAAYTYLDASNATSGLALSTQGIVNPRLTINNTGNVTINAPSSGFALNVNGVSQINAGGAGGSLALNAAAATQSGINITQSGQTSWLLRMPAGSSDFRIWNSNSTSGDVIVCNNLGNVTIPTPNTGANLTLNNLAAGSAIVTSDGTTGTAWSTNGQLNIGTTTNHPISFFTNNGGGRLAISANGNVTINAPISGTALTVSGSTLIGSPTGGDKGTGSINAQALYVQGVAVATGAIQTVFTAAVDLSSTPISVGQVYTILATAQDSLTSQTAFKTDTVCQFQNLPFTGTTLTYLAEGFLILETNTAAEGFNVTFTFTGSGGVYSQDGFYTSNSAVASVQGQGGNTVPGQSIVNAAAFPAASTNLIVHMSCLLIANSGTSGTFALGWAQNSSNATALNRQVGSWIRLTRLR